MLTNTHETATRHATAETPQATADDSDDADAVIDGRRTRRVRNKIAVIDAYIDLIAQGNERPSVAEVASKSGVSHRSVFRYFSDKDDLARASIDRHVDRMRPQLVLTVGPDAPLRDRIDHLLHRRFELFGPLGPVARLMRLMAPEDDAIGRQLTRYRELSRLQIEGLFAPELSALPSDEADEVLAVIDVLCSFESGELFTGDLLFSRSRSVAAVTRAMLSLLEPSPVPSGSER